MVNFLGASLCELCELNGAFPLVLLLNPSIVDPPYICSFKLALLISLMLAKQSCIKLWMLLYVGRISTLVNSLVCSCTSGNLIICNFWWLRAIFMARMVDSGIGLPCGSRKSFFTFKVNLLSSWAWSFGVLEIPPKPFLSEETVLTP